MQLNIYTPQEKGIVQKTYTLICILYIENASLCCLFPSLFSHISLSLVRSLMWEATLGTQPCHINMRTGELLPLLSPMLQSQRPAAVVTVANDTGYGRSC